MERDVTTCTMEEILEQGSEHVETNAEALKERGTRSPLPVAALERCAGTMPV